MVITVTNRKGGVGKTTTVLFLASLFYDLYGYRVLIIDLDTQQQHAQFFRVPQRNAALVLLQEDLGSEEGWDAFNKGLHRVRERTTPSGREVYLHLATAPEAVLAGLRAQDVPPRHMSNRATLKQLYDVILIDTQPAHSIPLLWALAWADHLVIPTRMEPMDAQATQATLARIYTLKHRGPLRNAHVLGLLPTMYDTRLALHRQFYRWWHRWAIGEAQIRVKRRKGEHEVFEAIPPAPVFPPVLSRTAVGHLLSSGGVLPLEVKESLTRRELQPCLQAYLNVVRAVLHAEKKREDYQGGDLPFALLEQEEVGGLLGVTEGAHEQAKS